MRVNMDSSIRGDPRFRLLARRLEVDWKTAIGACWLAWLACYERRRPDLPLIEIDIAAEIDGFADALIAVGLADRSDDDRAVLHGVEPRLAFLKEQAVRGAKGGKAKGKRGTHGNKPTLSEGHRAGLANSPDPSQPPDSSPDKNSLHGAGAPTGPEIPELAWRCADYLRKHVLRSQPTNKLSKVDPWEGSKNRKDWADTFRLMVERDPDDRTYDAIKDSVCWLFTQPNNFVVWSAGSLRKKWDNVRYAMNRPVDGKPDSGAGGPKLKVIQ